MKRKICESKTVQINEYIKETYQLIYDDGSYSITCTEENERTEKRSTEEVKNVTNSYDKAIRIFNLLANHGACQGTINDIVQDQMC